MSLSAASWRVPAAVGYFFATLLVSGWVSLKTGMDAYIVWFFVAFLGAALIYGALALAKRA